MLSSLLRSERAVQVNVQIMRAFVHLRKFLSSNEKMSQQIIDLESKYDEQLAIVFDILRELMDNRKTQLKDTKPKHIGFRPNS